MKKEAIPKSPEEILFAAAFEVARRFNEYDEYGSHLTSMTSTVLKKKR
jgi:hypothetical protein